MQSTAVSEDNTDTLINYYMSHAADRERLYSALTDQEKRRLYDLESAQEDTQRRSFAEELQALWNAINDNLTVDSHARHVAIQMYEEIKACWQSKGYIPSTLISDKYLIEAVRRTKDLVQTPPTSKDFAHRSDAFIRTMKDIRNEGALNALACIGATLVSLILLAGAACLIAATFGAFSEPFRIGLQTISALGAAGAISTTYLPGMFAVDQYAKARDKLTFASKMSDLNDAMHPQHRR